MMRASSNVVPAVNSDGLATIVQPAASAGASFHVISSTGKFHGVITPTTPTGSCTVRPTASGRVVGDGVAAHVEREAGVVVVDVGRHRDLGDRHARSACRPPSRGAAASGIISARIFSAVFAQHLRARRRRRLRPRAGVERRARGVDRLARVLDVAPGDRLDERARRGVLALVGLAGRALRPFAADELLVCLRRRRLRASSFR